MTGLRIEDGRLNKLLCRGFRSLLNPRSSILLVALFAATDAYAGAQVYTPLSASVRAGLQQNISDEAAPRGALPRSMKKTPG